MEGAMNNFQKRTLEVALKYAELGWAVLPTSKSSKRPLISGGSRSATTDQNTIRSWWAEFPSANIGIATGKISGFWVVDVDMKDGKNGIKALEEFAGGTLAVEDDQLIQTTASGGLHYLFQIPDGEEIRNAQGVVEGVDIRGEGGYIIAAPSAMNIEGEWIEYRWNDLSSTVHQPPEWAVRLSKQVPPTATADGKFDVRQVIDGIPRGNRDAGLFKFACLLRQREIPIDLAEAFVVTAGQNCTPPFDEHVARKKVHQVYATYSEGGSAADSAVELIRLKRGFA